MSDYDDSVTPAEVWLNADEEWGEIAMWLIDDIVEDFEDDMEAGAYL